MVKIKTYAIDVICKNCKKTAEYNIPLGRTVLEVLPRILCPNCKCKTIRRLSDNRTYAFS